MNANPMSNYHSARLREPSKRRYSRYRYEKDALGSGVDVVYGIRKKGGAEIQSIRFDKTVYSPEEVRAWLKKHKEFKPMKIEAAKKNPGKTWKPGDVRGLKIAYDLVKDATEGRKIQRFDPNRLESMSWIYCRLTDRGWVDKVGYSPTLNPKYHYSDEWVPVWIGDCPVEKGMTIREWYMCLLESSLLPLRENLSSGTSKKGWTVWAEYNGHRYVYSRVPGQPRLSEYGYDWYKASNSAVTYPSRLQAQRAALMLYSSGHVRDQATMLIKSPKGTYYYVTGTPRKPQTGSAISRGDKAMIRQMIMKYVPAWKRPVEAVAILKAKMKNGAWEKLTPEQKKAVTAYIRQEQKASAKLYRDPSQKKRRNPDTTGSVWERSKQREEEGKRRAKEAEADIRTKMQNVDRFQPTWALKNMIKAVEMGSWQNTVDDWQRYYEAKYILRLRRSRRRR